MSNRTQSNVGDDIEMGPPPSQPVSQADLDRLRDELTEFFRQSAADENRELRERVAQSLDENRELRAQVARSLDENRELRERVAQLLEKLERSQGSIGDDDIKRLVEQAKASFGLVEIGPMENKGWEDCMKFAESLATLHEKRANTARADAETRKLEQELLKLIQEIPKLIYEAAKLKYEALRSWIVPILVAVIAFFGGAGFIKMIGQDGSGSESKPKST